MVAHQRHSVSLTESHFLPSVSHTSFFRLASCLLFLLLIHHFVQYPFKCNSSSLYQQPSPQVTEPHFFFQLNHTFFTSTESSILLFPHPLSVFLVNSKVFVCGDEQDSQQGLLHHHGRGWGGRPEGQRGQAQDQQRDEGEARGEAVKVFLRIIMDIGTGEGGRKIAAKQFLRKT